MTTKQNVPERHSQLPTLETTVALDGDAASGVVSAPAPLTRVAAQIDPLVALQAAVHDLDLARVEARQCRGATIEARTAFSTALAAWNRTMPVQTQQQARQDYIDTNQRERVRKAAAGQGIHYASVSQTARALGGGGHNAKRGLGRAYKRGAYSKAEAMEIEAGKLRATAAARMAGSNALRAKLPSDR